MLPRRCLLVVLVAMALRTACADSSPVNVRVAEIEAPSGVEASSVQWLRFETLHSGTMLAAVARPNGKGPFPALLIAHGSHGFAPEYVHLAQEISRSGFITITACWFRGGVPDGGDVSAPIDCPQANPMPMGPSAEARAALADLVAATRLIPDVRSDRIAILGHSRGAGATVNYLEHGGNVRAAILNSSGYADEYITEAAKIQASILMLHGVRDTNAEFTRIERAQRFAAALRAANVPVQTHFYPEGVHRGLFIDQTQHKDEVRRIVKFLRMELN